MFEWNQVSTAAHLKSEKKGEKKVEVVKLVGHHFLPLIRSAHRLYLAGCRFPIRVQIFKVFLHFDWSQVWNTYPREAWIYMSTAGKERKGGCALCAKGFLFTTSSLLLQSDRQFLTPADHRVPEQTVCFPAKNSAKRLSLRMLDWKHALHITLGK